ncbi:ATP-dependent metallopeptidase FtsH/Yme1/Tma family protein [Campylobacter sp. RM16187]|uniref:ATP-dependent metallopeptidase FtsH/Yme1/Tma family protein n=1 Tax=Campylobacter sp. RM16187 TaxID=1660063 RepID=UPI0021B6B456|nr:ATP-dependent metallopeptidase FtsH/Yme1/Tma family protein [Campylobacter sp. RM16187]QKG29258.1 integral membrane ATP-dependent zinc metallopeptidase [Campylobacter sp. RM16187]
MQKFKFNKKNIIAILALLLICLMSIVAFKNQPKNIMYDSYEKLLDGNLISEATIVQNEILITTKGGHKYTIVKDGIDMSKLVQKVPVNVKKEHPIIEEILAVIFLIAIGYGVLFVYGRYKLKKKSENTSDEKMGVYEIENIFTSSVVPAISNVSFSDVAGIKDVKFELSEIVDFLKNPAKYRKFGIKMPKGVLMIGPPGVGKTLVAKAVAGEANVPFFYQSGAAFVQIYVGMGAKRVRELFLKAKAYAPSIIFIDEIDAVGKVRGGSRNDEREATLNQLLTEMDGFEDNSGVIVIAATNRIEMIDEALLRSGRFDRRIYLSMPDFSDRVEILKSYLKDKSSSVSPEDIAKISVGFSGAALATLVNEAAINALRNNKGTIDMSDFENVLNKVLLGKKRVLSYNDEEKKIQALYQSAKALSAYWFGVEFEKISLVEDHFRATEREIESKTQMLSRIKVCLAGMSALKESRDDIFSNAHSDIAKAKEIAQNMVFEYGMGKTLVPNPADVESILQEAYSEISEFLRGMKVQTEKICEYIIANESIDKTAIKIIIQSSYE